MRYVRTIWLIMLSAQLYYVPSSAQFIRLPEITTEAGITTSSGKQTPFWLLANQSGLISTDRNNQWVRLRLSTSLSTARKIDYDYGIDAIGRHDQTGELYLNQAYIRLKWQFIILQAGKMGEKFGNQDSSLTSGGLLWSGNARPMPKISVNIPDYTPVPFTRGFVEFRGGISHGWFGDNRFVNDSWLHHKYIYLQVGGRLPVHIHYGFHHYAEWGGISADTAVGRMPNKFSDFVKVFFARQGGRDASMNDRLNALGNHLGSRNFGLDYENARIKISLYWQTIFEDSSGLKFRNIKDGLLGISLRAGKKGLLSGFVYEFIHTTHQSGRYNSYWLRNDSVYLSPVPGGAEHWAGGNDDYFNNSIYRYGWTYKDFTMGSPLLTSQKMLVDPDIESESIMNNRVIAHHIGLEGGTDYLDYKIMLTYSLNYGTNSYPIKPSASQYAFLLHLRLHDHLPWGLNVSLDLAIDRGDLYGNNYGFRFGVSKMFASGRDHPSIPLPIPADIR